MQPIFTNWPSSMENQSSAHFGANSQVHAANVEMARSRFSNPLAHAIAFQKLTSSSMKAATPATNVESEEVVQRVWTRYVHSLQTHLPAVNTSNSGDQKRLAQRILKFARKERARACITALSAHAQFSWTARSVLSHPFKAVKALVVEGFLVRWIIKPLLDYVATPIYRLGIRLLTSDRALKIKLVDRTLIAENHKKKAFLLELSKELSSLHKSRSNPISSRELEDLQTIVAIAKKYDIVNFSFVTPLTGQIEERVQAILTAHRENAPAASAAHSGQSDVDFAPAQSAKTLPSATYISHLDDVERKERAPKCVDLRLPYLYITTIAIKREVIREKNVFDGVDALGICMAVQRSPHLLEHVDQKLEDYEAIAIKAFQQDPLSLEFASAAFKGNRAIVCALVEQNGLALQFASPELRSDPSIVGPAVTQNGLALEFASEECRDNSTLVLPAVRQNGYALRFASSAKRKDLPICRAACHQNNTAVVYVNRELWTDSIIVGATHNV